MKFNPAKLFKKLFKKNIDPNIETTMLQDTTVSRCEDMVCYNNIYFSGNSFVKQLYAGTNGVFLIIPLYKDDLDTDVDEQTRCDRVLKEAKAAMELNYYIFPVFVGNERCFFATDPRKPEEINTDPYMFIEALYRYTMANIIKPADVPSAMETILEYVPTGEYELTSALDTKTLERLFEIVSPMEDRERPNGRVKYVGDVEYTLRDKEIKIGENFLPKGINTGLIGKKEWFRVSDLDQDKISLLALFGGCLGLHKFKTKEQFRGLMYLITCGFGGLLPALDLLQMFTGNYKFEDINYDEEFYVNKKGKEKSRATMDKETVYLRRCRGFLKGVLYTVGALAIGLAHMYFVYSPLLMQFIRIVSDVGKGIAEMLYKGGLIRIG